jgi:uncharacterized FAD-dependent dehydrogenase
MALQLREISLGLDEDESLLPAKVAAELGLDQEDLRSFKIVRQAIDARRKSKVLRIFSVVFELADEEGLLTQQGANQRLSRWKPPVVPSIEPRQRCHRVLVVGMGPAGLFSALSLARYGFQVTLIERGESVEHRVPAVNRFRSGGALNPSSNIQFGEGGAGTFSDGKLNTRVKHPWGAYVLQTLVDFGAGEEILTQAKPHVGSDRLRLVLINFRRELLRLGVEIRFGTCLTDLTISAGRLQGAVLDQREELACDSLVLATGHSARDTYGMLAKQGVAMESKPFAIGLRVEHPAELINFIQYGHRRHPRLPTAEYALTYNDPDSKRGIYSFCMCPGGEVVLAASELGGVVVNGMSNRLRNALYSNSALVVAVCPDDFGATDPLAGMRFQRRWEEKAFVAGGSDYRAPAQNLLAFLGRGNGPLNSSCRPGLRESELQQVLPPFVNTALRRALPHFERRMRGFITAEATLVGVETRTSAPLRVLRQSDGQALHQPGLYPVGEGAGYAGGIMSAALDGLKAAEQIATTATNRSRR